MISIPGRIPIHIHPFFWFLIAMIGWLNSSTLEGTLIWSLVILISVLIHEYGHALTAIAFGQQAEINLVGLGGITKREGPHLPRWKEFLIVLNGPLAGFALFFVAYYLLSVASGTKSTNLLYALEVAVTVNLFWTILNLLPVLPLDGGHLMRIILEGAFGIKGMKIALIASIILAAVFSLYFLILNQLLVGALFMMMGFESYRSWTEVKGIAPEDEDQQLQSMIREGISDLNEGKLNDALSKFTFVKDQAPKGILYVTATQYAAHILAEQGQLKKAYDWLYPLKNRLSPDYLRLLQQLAFRVQEWEQAVQIGEQSYQEEPSTDAAMINAFSYGIMGKAVPAVGWLRCAIQQGLPDISQVIERREFDAIRNTPPFQEFLRARKD